MHLVELVLILWAKNYCFGVRKVGWMQNITPLPPDLGSPHCICARHVAQSNHHEKCATGGRRCYRTRPFPNLFGPDKTSLCKCYRQGDLTLEAHYTPWCDYWLRTSSGILTTAIGLARQTQKDDIYNGYHIPAGSTIMTNVWCVPRWEWFYRIATTSAQGHEP